ncbi:hypothetical protein [Paenibacillus sp.]|uniref:hypothetical protein n=1 Tax=Paenibacillus sp. TaxID=58172 RepID=UPI002D5B96D3|nr:hypothetical protein [Paenibacillus sp.]HZG86216.1 hypothetical protein [Paenibacillus sp.]
MRRLCLVVGVAVLALSSFGCSRSAESAQVIVSSSVTESLQTASNHGQGKKLYYSVTLRNNAGKPLEVDRAEPVLQKEISEKASAPAPAQPIGGTIDRGQEWTVDGEITFESDAFSLPLGEYLQGVRVYFRDGTSYFVET